MNRSPHILLVEDDREIATLVSRFLRGHDHRVSHVTNGREMDASLRAGRFDLVVLDLMLPGEDGLSICRRLRDAGTVPIIILTAKGEEIDRILGLEMGADDYLAKPFNPRELLARIRAVLRRVSPAGEIGSDAVIAFAGWTLDKATRRLFNPAGARVALTGAEFELLLALCERPRRVLSRDQLLDLTQGRSAGPFERSVDVLVSRLRQKMERNPREPELIQTIRSGGYMFSPEVAPR
ncbi:response regulator [Bosea sp. BK604]|uniref:response regulator n=1 Tax=Bosea sp. BK604 TaxID=2512180 RepID=UPI001048A144|nr:response regulator [Bosea sp. BK604]TCR63378.1 two-component system OmpR family response regulator [Bosea sp. BK604]